MGFFWWKRLDQKVVYPRRPDQGRQIVDSVIKKIGFKRKEFASLFFLDREGRVNLK